MDTNKPSIKFTVDRSEPLDLRPISGVWGGVTLNKQISMSVLFDVQSLPDYSANIDSKEGELKSIPIGTSDEIEFTRKIFGTYIMDLTTAKKVRDWLNLQIAQCETQIISAEV